MPITCDDERAGSFLSGGVDSLALLRENWLKFPPEHPRSIKDCLIVHGFDMGGVEATGAESEAFEQAVNTIILITADAQANLIPIHTNVRHLDSDVIFWMDDFAGAAMASVSHALSNRFSLVYFASSLDIPHLTANVSVHPLLDSDYGSTGLQIRHDGMQHSQLDKVRLLADWDVAPHALRSRAFRKRLAWDEERDWKGVVKRFDRKCLGSSMYKSYKSLSASSTASRS
jgi:hypothetical protein